MRLFRLCLLVASVHLFATAPRPLTFADIRPTMEEIFSYHVEYKELSPVVIQRAFKVYIEQFDPDHLYLLKGEVKPFLELSPAQIQKITEEYHRDDYSYFIALNQRIEASIDRARSIRAKEEQKMVSSQVALSKSNLRQYSDYAGNETQLRRRSSELLSYWLRLSAREKRFSLDSEADKGQAFAFWERKYERRESPYISQNQLSEHYLCMHILKAFVRGLDAHSSYYSPQEAYELRASLKKQFHGIGVVLRESMYGITIADLVTNGPAARSGRIQPGDYLIEVEGKRVGPGSYEEVLDAVQGAENTPVTLGFERYNNAGQVEFYRVTLRRQKIIMDDSRLTFEAEPFADGYIGRIDLPGFYDNGEGVSAEADLREAIRELKAKGPLHGLVIDMRENSGGFLSQAVKIAGLFVPRGVIVISKYSDGEVRYFRDLDGRLVYNGPLVLLTSKLSASAAEIVAQALQDYGQALIVGDERTYGKGSMQYQTITDEDATRFFKVTVGRFYTVSGRSNQIKGVEADIHVPTEFSPYNIGERFLEYPLSNDCLDFSLFDTNEQQKRKARSKRSKHCIPYLEIAQTEWRKMLPELIANSSARIQNNKNYQFFLKRIDPAYQRSRKKRQENFGVDDLQMAEAVNITKDMVRLKSS